MIVETAYGPDGVTLAYTLDVQPDGIGTLTRYNSDGTVASIEAMSGLQTTPTFPPLDDAGALATLLAVNGLISVQEAANIEHVPIEHIQHEALAWSAAAGE
jgi:hypothetical protein